MERIIHGTYFYGHKVSDYGIKHGYVDYHTLAEAMNIVYTSSLLEKTDGWEFVNGDSCYCEDDEVFQWYIISEQSADLLVRWTDEIVMYNEDLDLYVWGVTHYGTSWDYVLTDIRINMEEKCSEK